MVGHCDHLGHILSVFFSSCFQQVIWMSRSLVPMSTTWWAMSNGVNIKRKILVPTIDDAVCERAIVPWIYILVTIGDQGGIQIFWEKILAIYSQGCLTDWLVLRYSINSKPYRQTDAAAIGSTSRDPYLPMYDVVKLGNGALQNITRNVPA